MPTGELPSRTFEGSRARFFLLFVVAVVFVVGGILMISSGQLFGWIVVVFFGLGVIIFFASLIRPPRLELTGAGFRFSQLLARQTLQLGWGECSEFSAHSVARSSSLIVFDTQRTDHRGLQRANQALVGRNSGIMANYSGVTPAELAELMNRYRSASSAVSGKAG